MEKCLDKGIIKIEKNKYVKILKIIPINFNLKTQLEKESILNSYKIFLKTCNFDMQILIQSKKENLEKHFFILEQKKNQIKDFQEKIIYEKYIEYIKKVNSENKSSSKNFYIIIHQKDEIQNLKSHTNNEKYIIENLNEKYFKIKETLARCGNFSYEIDKKETIEIMYSFFNCRKNQRK